MANKKKCKKGWRKMVGKEDTNGTVTLVYTFSVFVHCFTAGVPVHTGNCCFQLEANIWLFIYSSQQGSSSALICMRPKYKACLICTGWKPSRGCECKLLFPLRWDDRKWRLAFPFVSDGQQQMPNSIKPSARNLLFSNHFIFFSFFFFLKYMLIIKRFCQSSSTKTAPEQGSDGVQAFVTGCRIGRQCVKVLLQQNPICCNFPVKFIAVARGNMEVVIDCDYLLSGLSKVE